MKISLIVSLALYLLFHPSITFAVGWCKNCTVGGITSSCIYTHVKYLSPTARTLTTTESVRGDSTAIDGGFDLDWITGTTYYTEYVYQLITYWNSNSNSWVGPTSILYYNARLQSPGTTDPTLPDDATPELCGGEDCSAKEGESAGWELVNYTQGQSPIPSNTCSGTCATEAKVVNSLPCSGTSCAATIQFFYTGESCGSSGTQVETEDEEPSLCETEWTAKKIECGGSANIGSFDWSTCSGTCAEPENDCSAAWANLAERCGDEGLITNWNAKDCTGQCKGDPTPGVSDGDVAPTKVTSSSTTNSDGTSSTTTTTTYNVDNTSYTTTTTTTYDSDGNATGTSTTESQDVDDSEDEETFSSITSDSFGEGYAPSSEPYDIPTRFNTFLTNVQSSGLFSFSSDYFSSLPSGGSSVMVIDGGDTFGSHSLDLSDTMTTGLSVLKSILLACFGFLSIRAIIMKR